MADAARIALELREPEGAFHRIEEWLRAQGFFAAGGEELVADVYLGYGLSETIRRNPHALAARALRGSPARGLCRPIPPVSCFRCWQRS